MSFNISKLLFALYAASALAAPFISTRQNEGVDADHDIVQIENEVTFLARKYVNQEGPYAREVLITLQDEMASLGDLILPSGTFCPAESYEVITTLAQTLNTLNNTDIYLGQVAHEIPYQSTEQQAITTAYCNANNSINSLEDYTYDVVGQSTTESNVSLADAETYTEISLMALVTALGTAEPEATYYQIAYNNTESAISTFVRASGLTSPYSCPEENVQPADSSETAYEYAAYLLDEVVPSTYANETAPGTYYIPGFCEIAAYMSAINAFLQA